MVVYRMCANEPSNHVLDCNTTNNTHAAHTQELEELKQRVARQTINRADVMRMQNEKYETTCALKHHAPDFPAQFSQPFPSQQTRQQQINNNENNKKRQ